MKCIIQIPCLNEESTLAETLKHVPRRLDGFDAVEWMVIDDGSTDRTSEVARELGVDHIIRHTRNLGLARAFMTGIETGLRAGADVIVNTDADNQYPGQEIPKLVAPLMAGEADVVIGARPIESIREFSLLKRKLQRLGSWVVRMASNTDVADAPSGFRAFTREAAMQLNVFNQYTYTLETIIQLGQNRMRILSVPIETNPATRPSRLMGSMWSYMVRSVLVVFRILMIYRPFRFFAVMAGIVASGGLFLGLRFIYFFITEGATGKVQSLILAAILLLIGSQLLVLGIIADLVSTNRKLMEQQRTAIWKLHDQIRHDVDGRG